MSGLFLRKIIFQNSFECQNLAVLFSHCFGWANIYAFNKVFQKRLHVVTVYLYVTVSHCREVQILYNSLNAKSSSTKETGKTNKTTREQACQYTDEAVYLPLSHSDSLIQPGPSDSTTDPSSLGEINHSGLHCSVDFLYFCCCCLGIALWISQTVTVTLRQKKKQCK